MVFGFGKKKVVETSPTHAQQREVSLHEVPSIIKELEAPRISYLVQEVKRLKTKMESSQKNIHEIILQLESDDLKLDDVDKNLKTIGKRGKDAVVSTIKKATKTRLTDVQKYEDAIELNNEVNQILKRMGDILGLHTRVMHVFARKYADRLKEEISRLAQDRNSLQQLITEQEGFKSSCNSILETVKKIHDLNSERVQKVRRINEIIQEKNMTMRATASLEQEISEMRSSPEYNQFLEIRKKIDSLDDEKNEIRDKVSRQFSKISRPLNKYSYVSSFDKPMKKLMEEMIADPYQVISIDNKGSIVEILQAVTKSVVAGNVSVKDSDRSVDLIEETIEKLHEFLSLKESYAKKISDLESNLSVFDIKKLEEKERDLEKARANLTDLEVSHKKIEEEIDENHVHIDSARMELEKSLTRLNNGKVVVRIQN